MAVMVQARSESIRRFRWAQLGLDAAIVLGSFFVLLTLRFDGRVPPRYWHNFSRVTPLLIVVYLVCNYAFGLYELTRRPRRWAAIRRTLQVGIVTTVVIVTFFAFLISDGVRPLPLGVLLFGGLASTAGIAASRGIAKPSHTA